MEAMACVEQGDAVALNRNGEMTVALFAGVETVTLAKAGAAHTASAGARKQRVFMQVEPYGFPGGEYGLQDPRLHGVCRGTLLAQGCSMAERATAASR